MKFLETRLKVLKRHFFRAAQEIGQNGENDILPYDIDATFIKEKADELSNICIDLFNRTNKKDGISIKNFTVGSERILTPSGSHGFRITTKIHPFWNLYLNGLGIAIAEVNEPNRSKRAHSYRLSNENKSFFNRSHSWRTYKEATLSEDDLQREGCVVVQTDISSFYEHIYHHRLENVINDLFGHVSNIDKQIIDILSKITSGRSFGLPVGGQCSRILAEVMMTPIDKSLSNAGLNWHRYVDDFTLICKSNKDAYHALSVLSHTLADYGLSLNKTKTTILSSKHYTNYVSAQLGHEDEPSIALRKIDLHFDPYSDTAQTEYEHLKKSFENIDVRFLLDLEKNKSEPDTFVMAQISRSLKFQDPSVAAQLCSTLLNPNNIDSFRSSWSKIMRGIYSVRANCEFLSLYETIDSLLDNIINITPHLLLPESNILNFLRVIRFSESDARALYIRTLYDTTTSIAVKRACIYCWHSWHDRSSFTRLINNWSNLNSDEQRMLWLAMPEFKDEGNAARSKLKKSIEGAWRLGFEKNSSNTATFAKSFVDWANNHA